MKNTRLEDSIVRYLSNEATASDLDFLYEWIKNPAHEDILDGYVKVHYEATVIMKNPDVDSIKKNLLKQIEKDQNPFYNKRIRNVVKYAAAAMLILGVGYFYQQGVFENITDETPLIVNASIEPGTDKAILTLEDGSVVELKKGDLFQTQNAKSNGEEIVYVSGKESLNEITYNYLTIPRGGQFFIKLSDGTKVWLNSESQLKYPVRFLEGQAREVELVYGEANFEVTPSSAHNGDKFIVFSRSQEVEVLGTVFNIKAYKDESSIYTTLVEGKVLVGVGTSKENMIPGQQSVLDLKTEVLTVKSVDVYNEIAWKDGVFSFENKSLQEVMKVLSRWYDMQVVFENEIAENEKFMGVFNRNKSIEKILLLIKDSGIIKDYNINKKTIYLK